MPKAYVIHGFIGSGKTTFAVKLASENKAKRYTPDEAIAERYGRNLNIEEVRAANLKIKAELWKDILVDISNGNDVILDYGFWKREQREQICKDLNHAGAEVIFYEVTCDFEIMKARALNRESDKNNKMSSEMFDEYFKRFEPMMPDEIRITVRT